MTNVYAVVLNFGYEGCKPPLAIFDDEKLADIFVQIYVYLPQKNRPCFFTMM